MYDPFDAIIEDLYYSTEFNKLKLTNALSRKNVRKYTDQELFLREDPNSGHYFPFRMDLTSNQFMCRQEFDAHQVQESLTFESQTDFLLCLKDNLRDYILTKLYQHFQEYYSLVIFQNHDKKCIKNLLNELLKKHDDLNTIMVKIKTLLGEEHETKYQFYTLYPGRKSGSILCFHIKSCTNIPEKMAMFNDYLYFEEQILPKVYYKTRRSMIVKCPKCGEKYHQEKKIYLQVQEAIMLKVKINFKNLETFITFICCWY